MTPHAFMELVAGDDWEIRVTLRDETGARYDLSGSPVMLWALIDATNAHVIDETNSTIAIIDAAAGEIAIQVVASATADIARGIYTDALRLVIGGVTSTLFYGNIFVHRDPFAVVTMLAARNLEEEQSSDPYRKWA